MAGKMGRASAEVTVASGGGEDPEVDQKDDERKEHDADTAVCGG